MKDRAIKFMVSWDLKQFFVGFIFGIAISLIYNTSMYFTLISATKDLTSLENKVFDSLLYNRRVYESEIPNVKLPSGSNMCGYDTNGPRILCTVFTHKKSFNLKAQYVDKTWGKRCDKTIFMSGHVNETEKHLYSHMDIVYLNVTDTNRLNLTAKTIQTLLYANKYLIDEFDWILKADDDTYVIMENLKRFLLDKCPTEDTFYGFRYKPLKPDTFKHDFNSGGAGYVISNKAVKQFTSKYASDGKFCRNTTGAEDVDIAKCLGEIGVKPGDSRDEFGLERFHPLSYESMWNITPMNKTYHHARFPLKSREDCCSSSSISFHYTTGQKALQMDHLLYKLRPTIYY